MNVSFLSLVPPGTGGVWDYASLVGNPLGAPPIELTRTTDTSSMKGDFLLLHFSGYGFQKRGIPLWLVKKVRALRKQFRGLGIVFHELFATGPVWGSAFWLSSCQQKIARDLLLEADFWITNRDEAARWLLDHSQAAPYRVLPVLSNVGEPAVINMQRQPTMVVFGSSGARAKVYQWGDGDIFRCAKRLGLQVHDIGPTLEDKLAQRLEQEGTIVHGRLPPEEVSIALSNASYGAVVYESEMVSKSSVFAAYCAHALCPVLIWKEYSVHAGLRPNVHYAGGFDAIGSSFIDARTVGNAARKWYEPHSIDAHVAALRALSTETRK